MDRVKAHMDLCGKKMADAAAKAMNLMLDPDKDTDFCKPSAQELRDAKIDTAYQISIHAHEHYAWLVCRDSEGMQAMG